MSPTYPKCKTIDEFIAVFPPDVQEILLKLRDLIHQQAAGIEEAIAYGIPTFRLNGNLVHFSAYEKHIGFYPGSEAIEVFKQRLEGYKTSKGTIQFPLDQPIPFDLITEIVKFRVQKSFEPTTKTSTKKRPG